jgi:glycosyltransferase involved in cell wall biosynthesis
MANKNILINATCYSEKPSGVAVFNRELTKNIIKINPDIFKVYTTIDFLPDFNNKVNLSNKVSSGNTLGNLRRWFWEQTDLNLLSCDLLFSIAPEGPILTKNKALVIYDILPVKYPQCYKRMKYYVKFMLPLILKTSKMLFFISESAKEETHNYFDISNIPFKIIYPGYDTESFKTREKGFIKTNYGYDKYFLYVGEMRPYKNISNAVLAYHRSNLLDYKFLIVGKKDNKFYPDVQKLVDELKLNENVIFLDYVSCHELPYFYNDAIAFVFPSEYEGFGLPPLEAMASGLPVITTKFTSIPEVCGNAPIYIDPKNISDISSAIINIVSDGNLRMNLREKSLERAKLFSWEKCAKEYYDVLISLV